MADTAQWHVEDVEDGTAIVAADGERIAWLAWDDEWEPDQTVYERANLIAAAPDLLAALEAMTGQYVAFVSQGAAMIHHEGDRLDYLKAQNDRVIAALAAIRKARGE